MIISLEGITTGRYIVITYSGTKHYIDFDAKTVVRNGVPGHEWGETIITGVLGDAVGGARPKALVSIDHVTPDGALFHFDTIQNVELGNRMRLDNQDEWRVTSTIMSIEQATGV